MRATGRTILLVEDDPTDRDLLLRSLLPAARGHEVVVAHDGMQALEYLSRAGQDAGRGPEGLPAVVFLDLRMPGLDGFEVLRRLRADERTRRVPVVVLTSSDQESDVLESYRLGASSYVRKPVDLDELSARVRALVAYWLHRNVPANPGDLV